MTSLRTSTWEAIGVVAPFNHRHLGQPSNLNAEVKEFTELSNKQTKMVGHRISFSDNLHKLKFSRSLYGPYALPW